MIRVLIADDHAGVRAAMEKIINETPDMRATADAVNPIEALVQAKSGDDDVLVLALPAPASTGLDLLRKIKYLRPVLPVLVVTSHLEQAIAVGAMKAGASGYLATDTPAEEVVVAIRTIMGGTLYRGRDRGTGGQ